MEDNNNINGMLAQSWNKLETPTLNNAAAQPNNLTAEQQQLFKQLVSVIQAASIDIYGDRKDKKYVYIVDLILKRINAALKNSESAENIQSLVDVLSKVSSKNDDNNIELSEIKTQLKDVLLQLPENSIKDIKHGIDSILAALLFENQSKNNEIKNVLDKLNQLQQQNEDQQTKKTSYFKQLFSGTTNNKTLKDTSIGGKRLADSKDANSQKNSIFSKILKRAAYRRSSSNVIAKLAQIGSDSNSSIVMLQDKKTEAKNIDRIAEKINKINGTDKTAENNALIQQVKEKDKNSKLASWIKKLVFMPLFFSIKKIGGIVFKISKFILGKLGKGLLAAILTPAGMYTLGFIIGITWKFLKTKLYDLLVKVKDELITWFTDFFNNKTTQDVLKHAAKIGYKTLPFLLSPFLSLLNKAKKPFSSLFKLAKRPSGILKQVKNIKAFFTKHKPKKSGDGKKRKTGDFNKGKRRGGRGRGGRSNRGGNGRGSRGGRGSGSRGSRGRGGSGRTGSKTGRRQPPGSRTSRRPRSKTATRKPQRPKSTNTRLKRKTPFKTGRAINAGIGGAITAGFNLLEYNTMKDEAEKFAKQYGANSLEELLKMASVKDKEGNDVTSEVHNIARYFERQMDRKMRFSVADGCADALEYWVPFISVPMQIGFTMLENNLNSVDAYLTEQENKLNDVANGVDAIKEKHNVLLHNSKVTDAEISLMDDGEEKLKALESRYKTLIDVQKRYEDQTNGLQKAEKEVYDRLESGWELVFFGSSALESYQRDVDNYKRMREKTLEANHFTVNDMYDQANGKDKVSLKLKLLLQMLKLKAKLGKLEYNDETLDSFVKQYISENKHARDLGIEEQNELKYRLKEQLLDKFSGKNSPKKEKSDELIFTVPDDTAASDEINKQMSSFSKTQEETNVKITDIQKMLTDIKHGVSTLILSDSNAAKMDKQLAFAPIILQQNTDNLAAAEMSDRYSSIA